MVNSQNEDEGICSTSRRRFGSIASAETATQQSDTPQTHASNAELNRVCRQTVMNGGTLAQSLENILCKDGRSYVFDEVSDWQGCARAAIAVGYCKLVLLERQGAKFSVPNASGEFAITGLELSQPHDEKASKDKLKALSETLRFPATAESYFNAIRDVLLGSGANAAANMQFGNVLFAQIGRSPDTNQIADSFYSFMGEWVCDTWNDIDMPVTTAIGEKPQASVSTVERKSTELKTTATPAAPPAKSEPLTIRFFAGKKRPSVGVMGSVGAMLSGGNVKVLANSVAFHAHRLTFVSALVDFYCQSLHRHSVRADDVGFKATVALKAIGNGLIFDVGDFATLILWVEAAPPKSSWDWAKDTFSAKMRTALQEFGVDPASPLNQ